ncbi:GTP cyclohydrolase II [Amycolatopsis sp. NBC_00345]
MSPRGVRSINALGHRGGRGVGDADAVHPGARPQWQEDPAKGHRVSDPEKHRGTAAGPAVFGHLPAGPHRGVVDVATQPRPGLRLCDQFTGDLFVESRWPHHYRRAHRAQLDGTEHLALVMGDVAAAGRSERGVLVRVHSECLTGDILGSLRCDCGTQLEQAMRAVAGEGCGAIVYLRGHEGRGIGLAQKIRAYALQETGLDTVDANVALGLPVDSRSYGAGAQILGDLGIRRLRLITNNPAKYDGLKEYPLEIVGRVALHPVETPQNHRYLQTKRDRMGHAFGALAGSDAASAAG